MTRVDPGRLRFGIEAEFALVDAAGDLRDFTTLSWPQARALIGRLDGATPDTLHRGDLGIRSGRWYVEGDERFDAAGRFLRCVPKGVETRTPPLVGVTATVDELVRQTRQLQHAAHAEGLRLTALGWNPWRHGYRPDPPYGPWERRMRAATPAFAAPDVYMMSYGPDVNVSHPDWSDADAIAVAHRLTAVSHALVPFAFSSPFARGRRAPLWSVRTAARSGRRPAARAFVAADAVPDHQPHPPVVWSARLPAERGRVEFKAFDAVADTEVYPSLLALVAGVALAELADLPGAPRSPLPDVDGHRTAALHAFDHPDVRATAGALLAAARRALAGTDLAALLDPLDAMLSRRRTPAHVLVDLHRATGTVPLPAVEQQPAGAP